MWPAGSWCQSDLARRQPLSPVARFHQSTWASIDQDVAITALTTGPSDDIRIEPEAGMTAKLGKRTCPFIGLKRPTESVLPEP